MSLREKFESFSLLVAGNGFAKSQMDRHPRESGGPELIEFPGFPACAGMTTYCEFIKNDFIRFLVYAQASCDETEPPFEFYS